MCQDSDIRHVPYWGHTQILCTTVKQVLNCVTWPRNLCTCALELRNTDLCSCWFLEDNLEWVTPKQYLDITEIWTEKKKFISVTYFNLKYSLITNTICVIWKIVPPHHTSAKCQRKISTTRILQTRSMKSCCYCSDSISISHTLCALS